MSTLAQLTDRVEQVLADTSNAIWSTTWIAEGLRQALNEYSQVRPQTLEVALTLEAGIITGREISIAEDGDLEVALGINRVWLPYTAADPEDPPNWRAFEYWQDLGKLYLPDGDTPAAGQVMRVFYYALQTISGLDSAAATTVRAEDETMLVNGAAGHVAASRGLDLTEQVTIDKLTAQQVRAWGLAKLQEFSSNLRELARRRAALGRPIVALPALDDYSRRGRGWV